MVLSRSPALERLADRLAPAAARLAVIGDYGSGTAGEQAVADLVRAQSPDFVVTTGDNNYPSGGADTIDAHVGRFYHEFIASYQGAFGPGAATNRFFPSLGNHDWDTPGAKPYLDYFTLPGNERYYAARLGPVGLFVVDSDPREPDGVTPDSPQGQWLKAALAASDATWKLVVFHHAPYSSGTVHGPTAYMQWPFQEWGATAVLSGHEHDYERFDVGGLPYFVNGLGGQERYDIGPPTPGSQARFDDDFGAMVIDATERFITFRFLALGGVEVDRLTLADGVVVTGAGPGGGPLVRVLDAATGAEEAAFFAFNPAFTGGVRVAAGDVDGDGVPDVVAGTGPGGGPHVQVFSGRDGSLVRSFFAYAPGFALGVFVAAGDVDGDGFADVITSADAGGGPHVQVFSGKDGRLMRSFFAFGPAFAGGVRVAAGDVDGDGLADVVAAAGPGGGPAVGVFSGADGRLLRSFFAYAPLLDSGVFVAAGDLDGGGFAEVVTGAGPGSTHVRSFDGRTGLGSPGVLADPASVAGVPVAVAARRGGGADAASGAGPGGAPAVSVFDGRTFARRARQPAYDPSFLGGVFVGGA